MQTISCVLCGEKKASLVYRLPDWQMGRKDVLATFVRCQKCGLIYQNPRPELSELLSLYPEEYECYQLDMDPRQLSWLKRLSASHGMRKRSQLVIKDKKTGRLLDVGCATGVFLKEMQQHPGWELHGIEPSRQAADIARKKTGIQVSLGVLEEVHYPDDYFDVVTLWDVLEHLPDPITGLCEIQRILKPDGIVVLRVPNGRSWDARLFGKYWAGFEPPRHFFVFDLPVLNQIVKKAGYQYTPLAASLADT